MLVRLKRQIIRIARAADNHERTCTAARICYNTRVLGCRSWGPEETRRMSDHHDKLRSALDALQAQLDEMRAVDPDVAAHLGSTIDQAKAVLAGRPTEEDEHRSMIGQLKEAVFKYEASHPTLSGNITSVIDALGQMGI